MKGKTKYYTQRREEQNTYTKKAKLTIIESDNGSVNSERVKIKMKFVEKLMPD